MSEPEADFADSDRVWFDRLRGLPVSTDHPGAIAEADLLRRALRLENEAALADPRLDAGSTPEARAQRHQRLLFRLRRDGLLDTPARRERRWAPFIALAAVVLVSIVLLPRMLVDETVYYDAPPGARGDLQPVRRPVEKPREAAEALARAFGAAGLRPAIYQRGRTFIVDAEVDAAQLEAAAPVLREAGVPVRAGWLRVEFVPR